MMPLTTNTNSRPDIDLQRGFLGHFVPPRHFNGPVDRADNGVAMVCVRCRAISTVEVCESYFWDRHDG